MKEKNFEEKVEDGGNVAVDIFMKYIEIRSGWQNGFYCNEDEAPATD